VSINQENVQEKKQKKKFTTRMQKKLVVLFIIVLLAFVGLCVRLFFIQKNQNEYSKKILSQQEYDSVTLPFRRGEIVDAYGTKLAISEKVYNLVVDSKVMHYKEEYLEPTITALCAQFSIDEGDLRDYLNKNQTSAYYVVLKQLSYEDIQEFITLQEDPVAGANIQGVWFEEEYKRTYPKGSLACDVIGFVQSDNVGLYGLEEYYNTVLSGTNGREYGYLNDDNTLERTTISAIDGYNIVTSIDANVQAIVEKYILEFNKEHENEARTGPGSTNIGVIIMDPNTAEVVAMASSPSFDLNNPYDLSSVYSEEEIGALSEDQKNTSLQELWRNYCIFNTYEPGSTAKPFTVATGLEYGSLSGNETFYCGGSLEVSGHKIQCSNKTGHGTLTVAQALEQSCNVAMMQIAAIIGKNDFMKAQQDFGFGLKTNIDLVGEARTDALVYNEDSMVASDLAISSFGQGYNITMIQMAAAFSSLINGGYYYEPHVVTRIETKDGVTIENIAPRILKQTVSQETSSTICKYLAGVVTNGTGASARPAGYTMGGKTGTAEKAGRDHINYLVSFVGFVPADNPKYLIYVVIDEPNVSDQARSGYATGLTRAIMTEALPYLGLYQTETLSEKEIAEMKDLDVTLWFKNPDPSADEIIEEDLSGDGTENITNTADN